MSEETIQNSAQPERPRKKQASEKEQKQLKFMIFLIAFVVVGAVFIFYRSGVIGGNADQKPVEEYLNAIAQRDFDAYVGAMLPKMAEDYKSDLDESGLEKTEFIRELYSDYFEEFGDDMSVALEFSGRSRVDNKYIESFKESYRSLYNEELSISSSFELDVSALFSGSESQAFIELECFVVKVGGKWYIAGCDYKTEEADE